MQYNAQNPQSPQLLCSIHTIINMSALQGAANTKATQPADHGEMSWNANWACHNCHFNMLTMCQNVNNNVDRSTAPAYG